MTRVFGRTILKTPCCGALYCDKAYASINFSAQEHWSDGRHVCSLSPEGEGLCVCACGAYFLVRQCAELGKLPNAHDAAPTGWETMTAPGQAPGEDSRKWFRNRRDTRPERALEPPDLIKVSDADCGEAIACNPSDTLVMIAARRGHWRHLNDPFREVYREFMETHTFGLPKFEPTAEQEANMRALVALLDGTERANYDEVTELYRELGEFDLAGSAVMKAAPNRWGETIALILRPLIAKRIASPVRYRWQ